MSNCHIDIHLVYLTLAVSAMLSLLMSYLSNGGLFLNVVVVIIFSAQLLDFLFADSVSNYQANSYAGSCSKSLLLLFLFCSCCCGSC